MGHATGAGRPEASLDGQFLESPEAAFLVFEVEILTSALPSSRAVMATQPDKGRETRLPSAGEVGDMIHKRHFHVLLSQTQFPCSI